jgi:hypothetical protein
VTTTRVGLLPPLWVRISGMKKWRIANAADATAAKKKGSRGARESDG